MFTSKVIKSDDCEKLKIEVCPIFDFKNDGRFFGYLKAVGKPYQKKCRTFVRIDCSPTKTTITTVTYNKNNIVVGPLHVTFSTKRKLPQVYAKRGNFVKNITYMDATSHLDTIINRANPFKTNNAENKYYEETLHMCLMFINHTLSSSGYKKICDSESFMQVAFPVLDKYDIKTKYLNKHISHIFRYGKDIDDVCKYIFGHTGKLRRKLVFAMLASDCDAALAISRVYTKHKINNDIILSNLYQQRKWYNDEPISKSINRYHALRIAKLLCNKKLTNKIRIKIIDDGFDSINSWIVTDTIRMLEYNFVLPQFKNLRQFHDDIAVITRKMIAEREFKVHKSLQQLNGLAIPNTDLYIKIPQKQSDLIDAGTELDNCIASYGPSFEKHKTNLVLLVDKDGKYRYAIEYRNQSIRQFVAKHNKAVKQEENIYQSVLDMLGEV